MSEKNNDITVLLDEIANQSIINLDTTSRHSYVGLVKKLNDLNAAVIMAIQKGICELY